MGEMRWGSRAATYLFRACVQRLLVFLGLCDAGGVGLPLGRTLERLAAIDTRERVSTLCIVMIQFWFLYDVCACYIKADA
jgi:hypothetical protein